MAPNFGTTPEPVVGATPSQYYHIGLSRVLKGISALPKSNEDLGTLRLSCRDPRCIMAQNALGAVVLVTSVTQTLSISSGHLHQLSLGCTPAAHTVCSVGLGALRDVWVHRSLCSLLTTSTRQISILLRPRESIYAVCICHTPSYFLPYLPLRARLLHRFHNAFLTGRNILVLLFTDFHVWLSKTSLACNSDRNNAHLQSHSMFLSSRCILAFSELFQPGRPQIQLPLKSLKTRLPTTTLSGYEQRLLPDLAGPRLKAQGNLSLLRDTLEATVAIDFTIIVSHVLRANLDGMVLLAVISSLNRSCGASYSSTHSIIGAHPPDAWTMSSRGEGPGVYRQVKGAYLLPPLLGR